MGVFTDIIDQRVEFEYGGKVKKVRKFISNNPEATRDEIIKYLKKVGYPGANSKYEELKKRGIFEGKAKRTDAYVISDELKEKIRKNVKLKPGQKLKFYDPKTGTGDTFGVKKGTPNYDKARYYGGKQEKDLTRKKEDLKKLTPRQKRRFNRRRARLREKRLQDPVKKAAAVKAMAKYRARPEVKEMYKKSRAKYEATPRRIEMRKEYSTKRQAEKGLWPQGNSYKENVWRDLYRSSQVQNPRWVVADEKGTPLTPDQYPKRDGKTFWGSGNYKRTKFLDTETGQLIKLDSNAKGKGVPMQKYLNTNFGKNTYENSIKSYEIKDTLKNYKIKIDGKEQNLGTVLRDRIYTPKEIATRTDFGTGVFHVSHDEGVGKNWWKSRVTTGDANSRLNNLDSTLKRDLLAADTEAQRTKVLKKYEKQVRKQPGGIISNIEGKIYGVMPTEKSVVDALGKKAKIRGTEGFKQLIAKLSDNPTCAVKFKKGGLTPSLDDCFEGGMRALKEKNINKPHQVQGAKQLMNAGKRIGASTFARRLLDLGILGEVAFIAGDTGIRMAMGRPFSEAFKAATFRETSADLDRQKRAGFTEREMLISKAGDLENEANSIQQQIQAAEAVGDDVSVGPLQDRLKKIEQELNSPIDNTGTKLQNLLLPTNPTNIEATRKLENVLDSDRAKSIYSGAELRDQQMGVPGIADYGEIETPTMKAPTPERQTLPSSQEYLRQFMRQSLPGSEEMENRTIDRFIEGLSPMEKFELEALDQSRAEKLYGTQGKFKEGGLTNLTRTTPPKRSLNKDSQGLASLPEYDR